MSYARLHSAFCSGVGGGIRACARYLHSARIHARQREHSLIVIGRPRAQFWHVARTWRASTATRAPLSADFRGRCDIHRARRAHTCHNGRLVLYISYVHAACHDPVRPSCRVTAPLRTSEKIGFWHAHLCACARCACASVRRRLCASATSVRVSVRVRVCARACLCACACMYMRVCASGHAREAAMHQMAWFKKDSPPPKIDSPRCISMPLIL